MKNFTIGFIGGGNMASSLIGGLIQDGYQADKIWVADLNEEQRSSLKSSFNVHATDSGEEVVKHADVLVLAVKPQVIATVCQALSSAVQQKKPLIVSVAAGVATQDLERWLGGDLAVVRTMPNTPALIGCGASALYATSQVSNEEKSAAESIMRAAGLAVWVDQESMIDTVTAISGSGPAYYFLVMEAMQKAAEKFGLDAETAKLLTLQTALGAARMAIESDESPAALRKKVTSPKGTTEAAINSFEENRLEHIIEKAIEAAKTRSEEISTRLSQEG